MDVQRGCIIHYSCRSCGGFKYTQMVFVTLHIQWWDLILLPWSVADLSDLFPINGICRNDDLWLLRLGHNGGCRFSLAVSSSESSVSGKPAARCTDSQAAMRSRFLLPTACKWDIWETDILTQTFIWWRSQLPAQLASHERFQNRTMQPSHSQIPDPWSL